MYQLIVAVFAIAIAATLVAGGVTYLNTDIGVRSATADSVVAGERAFNLALGAYRVANSGAVPGKATWIADLAPYFPAGHATLLDGGRLGGVMLPPKGMRWVYDLDGSGKPFLCLRNDDGAQIGQAVHDGLASVLGRTAGYLGKECGGEPNPAFDGQAAVTFTLQAGL
ncbi:conserved hypothetical protein [Hyphomicrobiales bacterium]|nr:conserved hypothetical protein [Hyphomicrobiales bacterium]CAH1702232.1 conserved hypothetical protein [Hyphomicrobiales bacterium]CAI0346435.1 conserved hypothetical protein [Hyphomicrobiales bacterium]